MAKVLVIDDEPSIATLVAEIVESYGHEVTIAFNGRQALELIKNIKFDMIVSDIMMPYLNGRDLLAAVRADPRLSGITFVLMSAVTHLAHLDHSIAADAFVVKPFDISVIDKLVMSYLPARPDREDGLPAPFSIPFFPSNRSEQYLSRPNYN